MNPKDWTVGGVIALMVIAGFFGVTFFVLIKWAADNPGLNQLIGAVIALAMLVAGFFFGSSTSSKTKDETIANLTTPGAPKP